MFLQSPKYASAFCKIYRKTPVSERLLVGNCKEKRFRHECAPVKVTKIFTTNLQNTRECLLQKAYKLYYPPKGNTIETLEKLEKGVKYVQSCANSINSVTRRLYKGY